MSKEKPTAEDILRKYDLLGYINLEYAIEAMQEYKDLHTAPLQARIDELEKQVSLRHNAYLEMKEENERLIKALESAFNLVDTNTHLGLTLHNLLKKAIS